MIPHLNEFDEVLVTGTELYSGIRVERLRGTVGTVCCEHVEGRKDIKIWPESDINPVSGHGSYDGKLWFDRATVEIKRAE